MKDMHCIICIGLIVFGFSGRSQTCAVSFSPAVHYTFSVQQVHLVSADFNADGHMDLASTQSSTSTPGAINVMMGSATGTFALPQTFTTGGGSNDLVATDLDGDGKQDLVVANAIVNSISVLLGTGTGSFLPAANYTVASGPRHLAFADFNNDLKKDIVVSATNVNSVTVLMGDGAGSFTSSAVFGVGVTPQGIIASDFNNDTNMDIASSNQSSNDISLLLGNGTGSFSPAINFSVSANPRKLTYGDFNNDGNTDIATSHFQNPQVSVLLGTGTGSFNPFVVYVSGIGAVCYGITSADFNNDGSIDIATPNNAVSTAGVLLGSSSGTFAAGVGFPVQNVPLGITQDDFNNDGKTDIAVTNIGGSSISVLLNTTDLPNISVTSSSSLLCAGQSATLTVAGANSYSWSTSHTSNTIAVSPSLTTSYSVSGTGTNSCRSTALFTQSVSVCTSLNDNKISSEFSVSPNPSAGRFIVFSASRPQHIEIQNIQGIKVLSLNLTAEQTVIDLSNESNGIYFLYCNDGRVKKLIKQ
jgi:hypothetical protein